jgi:hypothetical protein
MDHLGLGLCSLLTNNFDVFKVSLLRDGQVLCEFNFMFYTNLGNESRDQVRTFDGKKCSKISCKGTFEGENQTCENQSKFRSNLAGNHKPLSKALRGIRPLLTNICRVSVPSE